MARFIRKGLSFIELMLSVVILSVVFLYVVPVFLVSSKYTYAEQQRLSAALFAQSLMERFRENAKIYTAGSPNNFYFNLETIYNPNNLAQWNGFFNTTPFNTGGSYIAAYGENDAANNPLGATTWSKRLVINLQWAPPPGESGGGNTNYTMAAELARPADSFSAVQVPTSHSTKTTITHTTLTTLTTQTRTSRTSTTLTTTSHFGER